MLIKILSLCLFVFSQSAFAITLEFNQLPIKEVSHVFFKTILKKDFILSNDLIQDNRQVTISIKDIPEKSLITDLTNILKSQGITIEQKNNIYYLDLLKQNTNDVVNTSPISQITELNNAVNLPPAIETQNIRTYTIRHATPQEFAPLFTAFGITPSINESSRYIYYNANDQQYEAIEALLQRIDQPNQQLLVQAHLYEYSKNNSDTTAFGVALNLLNSKLKLNLNAITRANNMVLTLTDLQAVFSAISTDSRFNVISSPTLRLTNGKTSKFNVGTETPVLGSIVQNATGQTQQSINYRQSGVIFEVKPTIYQDSIYLDLNQQVSNFINTTTGVNNSPTLIKRDLQTTLNVKDGEIILLGGLADSKQSNEKSGLSWLPDFLKTNTDNDAKTDIFMVLQVTKI